LDSSDLIKSELRQGIVSSVLMRAMSEQRQKDKHRRHKGRKGKSVPETTLFMNQL